MVSEVVLELQSMGFVAKSFPQPRVFDHLVYIRSSVRTRSTFIL